MLASKSLDSFVSLKFYSGFCLNRNVLNGVKTKMYFKNEYSTSENIAPNVLSIKNIKKPVASTGKQ